jgi:hypothetical protein
VSWTDTHRYYEALRAIEAELDRTDGVLSWRPEYHGVFGDRGGLVRAIERRWRLLVQAQAQDVPLRELVASHPGLIAALSREYRMSEPTIDDELAVSA